MKNTERIDRILDKLRHIWKVFPDFRFFQFLAFIKEVVLEVEETSDLFYKEDTELEADLDNYIIWRLNK